MKFLVSFLVSNINSRFLPAQQGGCSQPSRTNMRFFVSPSLTTRTSPNWCRRWIWLRWEIAFPWHMPVSIILSADADYTCCHFPSFSPFSRFFHPPLLFINFTKSLKLETCARENRLLYYIIGLLQKLACVRLCELLRGTSKVSFSLLPSAWLRRDFALNLCSSSRKTLLSQQPLSACTAIFF